MIEVGPILTQLRTTLGLLLPTDAPPSDYDIQTTHALQKAITSAMRYALQVVPFRLVTRACEMNNEDRDEDPFCGTYARRGDGKTTYTGVLPEDCMRLISVRMSSWPHAVYNFDTTAGVEYTMQFSSLPGMAAGPHSPKVFLEGGKFFAHASEQEDDVYITYIPAPAEIVDDRTELDIEVHPVMIDVIVNYAAAEYLMSASDPASQGYRAQATELLKSIIQE